MFNLGHGSLAEQSLILAIGRLYGRLQCTDSVLYSLKGSFFFFCLRGFMRASTGVACRGSAQFCLEVEPDGLLTAQGLCRLYLLCDFTGSRFAALIGRTMV